MRAGDPRVLPRTQDSIAFSAASEWLVVNASPEVLAQIEAFPALHPQAPRHSPIAAVALLNGDLDHVTGLLSLRESQPLTILATARVRAGLVERNAMLRTLDRFRGHVTWQDLELLREVILERVGVAVTAIPVRGKLPVHLVGLIEPSPEDNVALRVRSLASGKIIVVATAVGDLHGMEDVLADADAVFLDGTFWAEDELVRSKLGRAFARDMAHVPVGGEDGSLAKLARLRATRRIYTHINNTNPMLVAGSPEREAVERAGWEVAFDGMEVTS